MNIRRNFRAVMIACSVFVAIVAFQARVFAINLLVYDGFSENHFATTAAYGMTANPTIANSYNFNTLLASQVWDAVLIDCPSNAPKDGGSGWQPTIDFINDGGRVVMSFWDWDNDSHNGNPGLLPAFGLSETTAELALFAGTTLTDLGTTTAFSGVTMPVSDWSSNWEDDGDGFAFSPASGTIGLATVNGVADPVIALHGRTIAALVIDDAGPTWMSDGSGVRLWTNLCRLVMVPEPSGFCSISVSGVALLNVRRKRRT